MTDISWWCVCMCVVTAFIPSQADDKPIVFKYVDQFELQWNDRGSGADRNVSIWRPVDYQAGFYPLGDLAIATRNRPNAVSLTVSAQEADALAAPLSFTEIWNDRGSGADENVKILKMDPPSGYTCLGHVAVNGYDSLPSTDEYRCVKTGYVTTGSYEPIWNDKGSGADTDVALFTNGNFDNNMAVFANTFTASVASHSQPSDSPYMLSGEYSILESLVTHPENPNLAIKVYQGSDSDLIWKDSGSGTKYDLSIYRPKGQGGISVGDIAVGYHSSPRMTFTVKAVLDDALAAPVDFRKRWDDTGSGADWNVAFWEPICPYNYVPLGHIAVRDHDSKPDKMNISCVNAKYATAGSWQLIWNDRGTGSDSDVSVYRADAISNSGQSTQTMGTIPSHGKMDRTAYVLKASVIEYIVGKPAKKYILTDVEYRFDDRKTVRNTPQQIGRTVLINKGNTTHTASRSISYTFQETHDWSRTSGLELGVAMSVSATIPFVSISGTLSTKYSKTTTTGKSTSESHSDTIKADISVRPFSQKTVTIMSDRYVADVPYTAKLVTEYADGTHAVRNSYRGVYRGASITEIRVVIDADVPLPPDQILGYKQ